MSYTAQQAALLAIVESVTDVGRVYAGPQFGDIADLYAVNIGGIPHVRGWEIGLQTPGVETTDPEQGSRHRWRNWIVQGYLTTGLELNLYNESIVLAEAIAEAIDADWNLANTCLDHDPCQISEPLSIRLGAGTGTHLCWAIAVTVRALAVI